MKGKSIFDNLLLAHKIISNIGKKGKRANMVIKLVMDKAYDRVDWTFLMKVLQKMIFDIM